MRAALLTRENSPLEVVDDIEVAAPGPGQVLVDVTHCGICHSDLTIIEAGYGPLPMVLGHEAAGVATMWCWWPSPPAVAATGVCGASPPCAKRP
jgi:Zn-dependent alcohol dehydrogenase